MFGFGRRKAADSRRGWTFLSRLARDSRGNTLAIVGAALIPLTAMIGSGVDMSRAYMAKTRLQMACDAAALAGRRVMTNDTMTTAVSTEATRFFNYNFNQGQYGTSAFTPTVTRPSAGTVRVAAATNIPTTVMRMFGFTTLPLSVTCDAALNFVNTDVMLVLDTTGSMDRDVNDNDTNVDANRKIYALRQAVLALYDELKPTQTQLEANGLRLRYGIVPYSTTVNVGTLIRAVNPAYLRSTAPYQSRAIAYTNYQSNYALSDTGNVSQTYSSTLSSAECTKYQGNVNYPTLNGASVSTGGPATSTTPMTTTSVSARDWGGTGTTTGTNRTCRRYQRVMVTQTGYRATGNWTYRQTSNPVNMIDLSDFNAGQPLTFATDSGGAMAASNANANMQEIGENANGAATSTVTWNGCIEERATTSSINTSTNLTIPTAAYDLNVNYIPTSDETRWQPQIPKLIYRRSNGNATSSSGTYMGNLAADNDSVACPSEARRMQTWTRANLETYVNGLVPVGYTYHDIGMIWGARLLSNGGVFAADNPDTFASMPVSRHIIFMTDGDLRPLCDAYAAWGVERNDKRISGSNSCDDDDLYARHMQRFQMICNQARGMGFSVWVIAFGTTLTSDMQSCASNPNQASTATDSATLIARFRQIGANIGALRLTQ